MQTSQTPNELIVLTTGQIKNLVSQIIAESNNSPKPEKEDEIYLTTKEARNFLKIGHTTIFEYMKKGRLKPVRFGRKLLFKKSDLIKDSGFRSE
jgi:excisionase family DNA binding protein